MKTKSAKAKGRRLQNWVKETLLNRFSDAANVRSAIMGESGADVIIMPQYVFPFSIECKNAEQFTPVYKAYEQAARHEPSLEPLVFIKMNGKKPLVIMDAETFIKEYA